MDPATALTFAVAWLGAVATGPSYAERAPALYSQPAQRGGPNGRLALRRGWIRRIDDGDLGLASGWQRGGFAGETVTVPNVANAGFAGGEPQRRAWHGSVAWYRLPLRVPSSGRWRITFGAANFSTRVWLDGRLLGHHRGAEQPFSFDLPPARAGAPRTLVARVDYRDPDGQKELGAGRAWFNYGGLTREVTIRPLHAADVERPGLTTRLGAGGAATVTVSAAIRNRTGHDRTIVPGGSLARGGRTIALPFAPVVVPARGVRTVRARVRIAHPDLWSPRRPALYRLRLSAGLDGGRSDLVGLRQIAVRGGHLELNGRRLWLRGASLQEDDPRTGDALDAAARRSIVADLRRIGANATRAQHRLDPALLEALDRAGILVWQQVGPFESPGAWRTGASSARLAAARGRVLRAVADDRIHPSILSWSLVNEVAGNGHDRSQVRYVDELATALGRVDPGRPIAVDVWGTHLPRRAGALYRRIDLIGLTDYSAWYEGAADPRPERNARTLARLRELRAAFPGRALVISEFGAEGSPLNGGDRPGSLALQAEIVGDQLALYRHDGRLSGALVWALRDFALTPEWTGGSIRRRLPGLRLAQGLNSKGLFTRDGRAKPAAAVVRRLGG